MKRAIPMESRPEKNEDERELSRITTRAWTKRRKRAIEKGDLRRREIKDQSTVSHREYRTCVPWTSLWWEWGRERDQ